MKQLSCKRGVSVIIPTFNRASYLYSTLICLCNQKVAEGVEYEIVIVDSGDDETESVVHLFQNPANVPVIYKKIKKCSNRSLVRNRGASLARYNILCFLDNDMLTPPDFIQRHYDEHQRQNHLVVMGCRRSLTEFDISALGEDTLRNNFDILEKLPWYADERLETYEDKDQWRFVFSHTLSIERNDFYKAGQFNVEFGEHWGFEDLELGFNLMQNGCAFLLIKDSFTYHQPHFSQSRREQHANSHNQNLFLELHNSYEVELYTSFYTDYRKFDESIERAKQTFKNNPPTTYEKKHFERILGCIYESTDMQKNSRFQLGSYIPVADGKCRKILILESFFELDRLLQVSVLSEAFRIADTVYFRKLTEDFRNVIQEIAKECGFSSRFSECNGYTSFTKEEKFDSLYYSVLIPEVYSPEKRYVYSYLCKLLTEHNKRLFLSDLHNNKTFSANDLRLNDKDVQKLNTEFSNYFGAVKFQHIHSFSRLHSDANLGLPNSELNYVIHDNDFSLEKSGLYFRGMQKSKHVSSEIFSELTFMSAYDACMDYKTDDKVTVTSNRILCFMENGYLEDGIDLILDAFLESRKERQDSFLTIKIPDYKSLFEYALPFHNEASKERKLFLVMQKFESDYAALMLRIHGLGLDNSVRIISKNCSIKEAVFLIGSNEKFVFASRGCYVPPEVYIAILLKKQVIVSSHHKILPEFHESCCIVNSEKYDFSSELKVPRSCMNSVYYAYRCDVTKIENCLKEKNFINNSEYLELYEHIKKELLDNLR